MVIPTRVVLSLLDEILGRNQLVQFHPLTARLKTGLKKLQRKFQSEVSVRVFADELLLAWEQTRVPAEHLKSFIYILFEQPENEIFGEFSKAVVKLLKPSQTIGYIFLYFNRGIYAPEFLRLSSGLPKFETRPPLAAVIEITDEEERLRIAVACYWANKKATKR